MRYSSIVRISGRLGLWSLAGACSLQMPKETEVFAPDGGRAGSTTGGSSGKGSSSASGGSAAKGGTSQTGGVSSGGSSGVFDAKEGLVAHFPFDETSGSAFANVKNAAASATCVGTCSRTVGRLDGAVGIRNANSNVDWIELPPGLLSQLSAATISLWMRDLSTVRNAARLFQFSRGTTEQIYFAPDELNSATSRAGGHLGGTHRSASFIDLWTTTSSDLTDKAWHHIVVTWSAASIQLYLDGSPAGSETSSGILPSDLGATSADFVGRAPDDSIYALYGEVDDLRIYSRALSAGEVTQLRALR